MDDNRTLREIVTEAVVRAFGDDVQLVETDPDGVTHIWVSGYDEPILVYPDRLAVPGDLEHDIGKGLHIGLRVLLEDMRGGENGQGDSGNPPG